MLEQFQTKIMGYLNQFRISDFHIHSNRPITYRVSGEITIVPTSNLSHEDLTTILKEIMDGDEWAHYETTGDLDFAIMIGDQRFRANAAQTMAGHALVLRVIVTEIPDVDMLGLPDAVHDVLTKKSGLVLVTGQTGSGKSTSLAAMVDKINTNRAENIITIEDPIEFVHKSKKSIVTQREVGRHTKSFASALKGALRQDPDIILLGELRDYETISMAMEAAETGHLVFGTLHTSGAAETVNRIIDSYPAEEQSQARSQLSQSLRLVLSQQLLPRRGGGRIGAFEVMVNVSAVANLIRENKIHQIASIMQTGANHGMFTMEKYLELLTDQQLI